MATVVDTPTKSNLYLLETDLQDDPLDTSFVADGEDVLEDDFEIDNDLHSLELPPGYQPAKYECKDKNLVLLVQENLNDDDKDEEFVQSDEDADEEDFILEDDE